MGWDHGSCGIHAVVLGSLKSISRVYSSFPPHAEKVAADYTRLAILVELGSRGTNGGQEDMISDVVLGAINGRQTA